MAHVSTQACHTCKSRKRKCDKLLPTCSLCGRFRRLCHYGEQPDDAPIIADPSHTTVPAPTLLSTQYLYGFTVKSSIDAALKKHLSQFVGNPKQVQQSVDTYFATIHLWFPVIEEIPHREHLAIALGQSNAEFSLLTLCMALINALPNGRDVLEGVGPLYTAVKSSIAILESIDIQSLQLVRARLLLSLFEVGHGFHASAYLSIATLARAAALIGINCSTKPDELNVWWGIVILDRYHTLVHKSWPAATQGLGRPYLLPIDPGDYSSLGHPAVSKPLDLSTPSDVRVGPFARQAQASHLLDRLLTHLQEPTTDRNFNLEEAEALERTLQAFTNILPRRTPRPWPKYCGAVGISYSALIALYESRLREKTHVDEDRGKAYQAAFEPTLKWLSEIPTNFNAQFTTADIAAMSPFVAHSVSLAIDAQHRLDRDQTTEPSSVTVAQLEILLEHLSKRWSFAHSLKHTV